MGNLADRLKVHTMALRIITLLFLSLQVALAFRMNADTCWKTVRRLKKACREKANGCDACLQDSMSQLKEACGEKAARRASSICKARGRDADDKGQSSRKACWKTALGMKKACREKADGCDACLQESMSQLKEACGEKAERHASWMCKARGAESHAREFGFEESRGLDEDNENEDSLFDFALHARSAGDAQASEQ